MRLSALFAATIVAFVTLPASAETQPKQSPTTRQAPAPAPSNQYATEAEAKQKCGSDVVVWVNLSSRVYHYAGYKDYGHTKRGAYMCKMEADRAGNRGAKGEKPKA